MVYKMAITYDGIVDVLDVNYITGSTNGYTLASGIYEVTDINMMLKSLLPKDMKVIITIDDIILKLNLTTNKTIRFTKKYLFFQIVLGFSQSHSGEVGDIERFFQIKPGTHKNDKPINIMGVDKVHLKSDCIQGSIVNGNREQILYSFALSSTADQKIYKEHRIKLFKTVNKSVLSNIAFYLENIDHKPSIFHDETISFTCQQIKKEYSFF